ncbi:uncharacterized protein sS8_4153 [Methylocaldum marinum]|jgi:hypothetical protein|uniref:Uncharacterized protein n=1 Tax=Methylocaldum marinum TaxID=1432792 RepID=A0A250KWN9_9GAMM|nr:hypothetical protein [Methylocaldum marinum]BBA36083.1 uncharacterized protein sS8_4153 [Methylocaldum marinum]
MKERIVRRTKEEIKKMRGKTDHVYVGNTSDKEIERQVENDPDSYIPTEEELKKFKPVKKDDSNE